MLTSDPHVVLRCQLIGLCLRHVPTVEAVEIARAAYAFVIGDTTVETPPPNAAEGVDVTVTVTAPMPPAPPEPEEPIAPPTLAEAIQAEAEKAVARPPVVGHGDEPSAPDLPAHLAHVLASVRRLLGNGFRVNGSTLAADLNISQVVASKHLRAIEEAGILVRHGAGNKTAFVLSGGDPPAPEPDPEPEEPAPPAPEEAQPPAVPEAPPAAAAPSEACDRAGAALVADKPDLGGFPVQTKTLAEVEPRTWQGWEEPAPKAHGDRGNKAGDDKAKARAELAEHGADQVELPPGLAAKVTKVTPRHDHPGGPAETDDVIAYLRHGDDCIVEVGKGLWLVNGTESMNRRQLYEKANRRRRRAGLDLFEMR